MLMRCVDLLGVASHRGSAHRKAIGGDLVSVSVDTSSQFKGFSLNSQSASASVKIIHAGGRVERHPMSFPASMIMEKYPDMCVACPDVFQRPHDCILSANDILLIGHKYFLLPISTARKLKRKHQAKAEHQEAAANKEKSPEKVEVVVKVKAVTDEGDGAPFVAKDFFISNERCLRWSPKQKSLKRKPLVPPILRRRMLRHLAWEPTLPSVQELSP